MGLSDVHIRYPESRKRYGRTGTVKLANARVKAARGGEARPGV
jgi:hypothetical protein